MAWERFLDGEGLGGLWGGGIRSEGSGGGIRRGSGGGIRSDGGGIRTVVDKGFDSYIGKKY